jgi:hypothetical protein
MRICSIGPGSAAARSAAERSWRQRRPWPSRSNASGSASSAGGIRWHNHCVSVSHVLGAEYVALEEVDDGLWTVCFGPLVLGRFDERRRRVEDPAGYTSRIPRRVEPIPLDESVTYHLDRSPLGRPLIGPADPVPRRQTRRVDLFVSPEAVLAGAPRATTAAPPFREILDLSRVEMPVHPSGLAG